MKKMIEQLQNQKEELTSEQERLTRKITILKKVEESSIHPDYKEFFLLLFNAFGMDAFTQSEAVCETCITQGAVSANLNFLNEMGLINKLRLRGGGRSIRFVYFIG